MMDLRETWRFLDTDRAGILSWTSRFPNSEELLEQRNNCYVLIWTICRSVLRKQNASSFCRRVQNFHRLIYKSTQLSVSTGH